MIVVNTASYLHYVSGYAQFASLEHADWHGFTVADAVFPAFVFMTGVSIPLAMAGQGATGLDGAALRRYLDHRGLAIDWTSAETAPSDALINSLSMALPFDAMEKQALLEAPTMADRRVTLVALLEIDAAGGDDDEPTPIQ